MNEKKNDNTKKEEVKLPQLHYGILGTCYVHTNKGMCLWQVPANMTDLEEIIKYLDFTKSKYESQIEINKKKAEEDAKLPSENKKEGEFKVIK